MGRSGSEGCGWELPAQVVGDRDRRGAFEEWRGGLGTGAKWEWGESVVVTHLAWSVGSWPGQRSVTECVRVVGGGWGVVG